MTRWIDVCAADEVPEGGTLLVRVEGEPVCLYGLEDGIFATHDRCTHANASLADGFIQDGQIECPIHVGTFDIRTGRATRSPCTQDVQVYAVRVVSGRVEVQA
jgi:nitrite reductase/ring-hydroxylating ferredoxin subunit